MRRLLILAAMLGVAALGLLAVIGQTTTSAGPEEPKPTETAKPTDEPKPTEEPKATETPKPDADSDGITDAKDNCPDVANPDQEDVDKDKIGDACDDDSDDDGIPNKDEEDGGTNPKDDDTDGDNCGDYPEDKQLLGDKIATDPKNPLDFDDTTGDSKVLIQDVLGEVQNYFSGDPGIYDRTGDEEVQVDDILHVVQQYGADCSAW